MSPWLHPIRLATLTSQTDVDTDALADAFSGGGLDGWAWATAGIVFVVGLIIARLAAWGVRSVLRRRVDRSLAALVGRLVGYAIVVFALVYALDTLGVAIGPLLGALGIIGIALAFAFRDILENFISGILLQLQRPFTYGDEVAIDGYEGTIREVSARMVTMVTPAGETIRFPATTVITSDINNYTEHGFRRTTVPIGVAYGSDLRRAEAALRTAVERADGVVPSPPAEVLLDGFGDSSIDFVVRFWHRPSIAEHWRTKSNVAFEIERALVDAGITIPFPQRTLHLAERPEPD
jgi:small-conductance mechanosensitive channel